MAGRSTNVILVLKQKINPVDGLRMAVLRGLSLTPQLPESLIPNKQTMFELFPDGPVYEYSQFVNITFSFIWAFLLASIVAITHKLTFTGDYCPKNFFQS